LTVYFLSLLPAHHMAHMSVEVSLLSQQIRMLSLRHVPMLRPRNYKDHPKG